jgi:hypothetical protein
MIHPNDFSTPPPLRTSMGQPLTTFFFFADNLHHDAPVTEPIGVRILR